VVVETNGPLTYVARFDSQDDQAVYLLNVGVHDAGSSGPALEEFLARTRKFGVKAEQKHLRLPSTQVRRITRLSELG